MSRFTFARGNARKVLALPLYLLGATLSLMVPRSGDHWVFGSGIGVGEGALALYREVEKTEPATRLVWLAGDKGELRRATGAGMPAVLARSWQGLWLTLRARVIVVTHGFGDVNRYGIRGGFIVQLWHGIPLKLIHLDSPATTRSLLLPNSPVPRRMLQWMYRRAADGIRLMPAASEVAAARLRTAFRLPADRVVVTGDPRDDVLLQGTPESRGSGARAALGTALGLEIPSISRLLLYAPTWRDGKPDPCIPDPGQWARIAGYLERTDSFLIVRPHPLGVGDYAAGLEHSPRIRLLGAELQNDITPLLPAVELLVTDYSSIAYDFALTGGGILFLAPDIETYSRSRGLYEPYERFSGGSHVASWDALLELLELVDRDAAARERLSANTLAIAERNHAFHDGQNSRRVYTEIIKRLDGAA